MSASVGEAAFALTLSAAVIRISVPYVLAALGGFWSERAGVINIALEGLLLMGAFAATVGAWFGHSALIGVTTGVLGGMILAGLYAWLTLVLRADQVVCGIAINLLADGGTRFFMKVLFDSSSNSPRVDAFDSLSRGGVAIHPIVLATILLVAVSTLVVYRTPFGLRLRAVGEHPEAAASLGISVSRIRLAGLLLSGALAGLGGVWLAADQRQFVAGMSNGRGYIALAALILGRWRPQTAALAALGFGAAEALQIALQTSGRSFERFGFALQALPYVLTLVALAGLVGRSIPPKALGRNEN